MFWPIIVFCAKQIDKEQLKADAICFSFEFLFQQAPNLIKFVADRSKFLCVILFRFLHWNQSCFEWKSQNKNKIRREFWQSLNRLLSKQQTRRNRLANFRFIYYFLYLSVLFSIVKAIDCGFLSQLYQYVFPGLKNPKINTWRFRNFFVP